MQLLPSPLAPPSPTSSLSLSFLLVLNRLIMRCMHRFLPELTTTHASQVLLPFVKQSEKKCRPLHPPSLSSSLQAPSCPKLADLRPAGGRRTRRMRGGRQRTLLSARRASKSPMQVQRSARGRARVAEGQSRGRKGGREGERVREAEQKSQQREDGMQVSSDQSKPHNETNGTAHASQRHQTNHNQQLHNLVCQH